MKTRTLLAALATCLLAANGALALTETVDGIEWTYTVSKGRASVGGGTARSIAITNTTLGAITIPSTLGGYPVTSIGDFAFCGCNELTSVTIPDSVIDIGNAAFYGCICLAEVIIPHSVKSIGYYAFYNCISIVNLSLPCVNSIGDHAFALFSGVYQLGDRIFLDVDPFIGTNGQSIESSLKSVEMPCVTNIEDYAFSGLSSIVDVVVPGHFSMSSVFPNSYQSITNVAISNKTLSIVDYAFSGCSGLISVTISDSVTNIGNYAFNGCCSLQRIEIPSNVNSIGKSAFQDCRLLQSIVIPSSTTSIGQCVFYGCNSLVKMTVPQCVMSTCLFGGVPLRHITLDSTVSAIFEDAFEGCKSITKLEVDDANEHYYVSSINGCLYDRDMTTLLCCPKDATRIVIPEGVIKIGNYAFAYCTNLVSVSMPATLKTIGKYAFFDCTMLPSVVIPNNVMSIENYAFLDCSSLISATISDAVTNIGDWAFGKCQNLRGVTIPASVQSLSPSAFNDCNALWTEWYKAMSRLATNGSSSGGAGCATAECVSLIVTNIIVHYVTQSIPSDAVIPPTTAGIVNVITEVDAGAPVAISPAWAEQYPDFEAKFGSDFSAAIVAETGKRDGAGNAMRVWQDFVAGTDPTDPDSVFTASITFDADTGLPVISWSPELSPEEAAKRTYRKYGKVKLTDEDWTEINGDEASYNFFKVSVEMTK